MANHGGVAVSAGQVDRLEGLGQGADLIDLDENRIRAAELNTFCEPLSICYEQVIADELNFFFRVFR